MIRTTLLTAVLALAAPALLAQSTAEPASMPAAQSILGRIEGDSYVAPSGTYKITLPVLPELGGEVMDTPEMVQFQDSVNTQVTIACIELDPAQNWLLETKGKKDYLVEFFARYVHTEYAQQFPGSKVESARYLPSVQGGSVLAFNLVPGGTMFSHRITLLEGDPIPVAKRGNILFIRGKHLYSISTELAEKAIERSTYNKTTAEEDDILRKRLLGLIDKMAFLEPAKK